MTILKVGGAYACGLSALKVHFHFCNSFLFFISQISQGAYHYDTSVISHL
jgi:hypothetical protein